MARFEVYPNPGSHADTTPWISCSKAIDPWFRSCHRIQMKVFSQKAWRIVCSGGSETRPYDAPIA